MKLSSSTWVGTLVSVSSKIYYNIHMLRRSLLLLLSHFSCVQLSATLRAIAHQAPLSMGFSRQEHWSGQPWPPPGDLPNSGIEPAYLMSLALTGMSLCQRTTWEALWRSQDPALSQLCCFLIVPLWFLHSYPSLIRNNLPFWIQGRSKKLKPFFFSSKKLGDTERCLYSGGPPIPS